MRSRAGRPAWPFRVNRDSPQAVGLLAWYPLTPIRESWIDLISGLHLAPSANRPARAETELGQAWRFTAASSQGFSLSSTSLLAGASAATVTFWMQTTTVSGTGTPFNLYASNYNLLIYRNASNIRAFINPTTNYGTTPAGSLVVNTWYHVAVAFDGSGADNAARLKIYLNAKAQSLTYGGTIPASLATGSQRIDAGVISGGTNPLDGLMADLRVYNRALSAVEVAALWSPATRFDLYWQPRRRFNFAPEVVVGNHDLTATGISTGAPTVGSPAITQIHALSGISISTGAPALGTPAITQVHALTATEIATGAPALGTPAITQVHALTATEISTGAPTLGTPVAAETHALTATGIATGAPALGTPAITQVHALTATALDTTPPSLALPAISQLHVLVAMIIATGAATVGNPYLVQGLMVAPSSRTFSVPAETRSNSVSASSRTRIA